MSFSFCFFSFVLIQKKQKISLIVFYIKSTEVFPYREPGHSSYLLAFCPPPFCQHANTSLIFLCKKQKGEVQGLERLVFTSLIYQFAYHFHYSFLVSFLSTLFNIHKGKYPKWRKNYFIWRKWILLLKRFYDQCLQ